jgi:hypothetical protein
MCEGWRRSRGKSQWIDGYRGYKEIGDRIRIGWKGWNGWKGGEGM